MTIRSLYRFKQLSDYLLKLYTAARWAFELWWPRSPWHGWGRTIPNPSVERICWTGDIWVL